LTVSRVRALRLLAPALAVLLPAQPAPGQEQDAATVAPAFREGDVLGLPDVARLQPWLPPEFWDHRDFFFYEGMELEIGPFHRDYAQAEAYRAATERFRGQPRIGPDGSLEGYTAGMPFPPEDIDCRSDPQAGTRIMWSFDYSWRGDGGAASFYYSYWDRGEQLPLYYEGHGRAIQLSHRVEPSVLAERSGDLFRGEKRKGAFGIEVSAPFDARGINIMTYRYKSADGPRSNAKNDDTWVYIPSLRRVRRISTAQRTDAISGTDFTFDDLRSFAGIVPQYHWTCLGEMRILAPMNSRVRAYPYDKDHNFGPYGLSFASDRWELRHAWKVRMIPKNPDHPYHHKDLYIDKQTLKPLYSFAYDRKEELWKIIWHNKRWSEDATDYYEGWEEVPEPRDLRVVSDIIVNVQTGTGNRIEFWDSHGTPLPSRGRVRRYIDVGRLSKGR